MKCNAAIKSLDFRHLMDCSDPRCSSNACIWHGVTHLADIKIFYLFTYILENLNRGVISLMVIFTSCRCRARISPGVLVIQILRTVSYDRNQRCVRVRPMGALAVRPSDQRATIRQIAITLRLLRLAHERIHQKSQKRKDSVEIQKGHSHFGILHGCWIEKNTIS